MKKLLLAFFFISVLTLNAQQRTCGTPVMPQQFETWLQSVTPVVTPGKYGTASAQSVFNIPVIVHILHNNETINSVSATSGNNLNAAQVVNQINILNKDYNGTNSDTNLIPAIFKPLLGKFNVNFCLAVVNPTGAVLAEPGIDRIDRVAKGWSSFPYSQNYMDATVKPNSIWNPNLYLNIWVVPLSNSILGYATFPAPSTSGLLGLTSSFGSANTDGVVILNTAFGSVGTAQSGVYNKGRTATHEVGHWLGLRHTWGDSNCGSDFCNDTPISQNANYGCPGFPYKLGSCSGNTTGEMTMNYMDYTNDACMYMFTADQKNRAQLILVHSPFRAALITSTVCNLPTVGNDVGITFVSSPTYSQVINCVNNITPSVKITNYGSTNLTNALFSFNVNGVNTQTLNWNGNLAPNTSLTVTLSQINNLTVGSHVFSVNVSSPNGGTDNNLTNNNNLQSFSIISNFAFSAPSVTNCLGTPLVLTASGATTYSWSTGATTPTISLNPSVTTVYTVTGINGACTNPKTVTVTVQNKPAITLNDTTVCENVTTMIKASGAFSYSWSTGAVTPTIGVNLTTITGYTLTGFSSGGCATTKIFNVSVDPSPHATLFTSHVSCGACSDATISILSSAGTSPYTYTWIPGNIQTPTITNVAIGCYTLTTKDANGCLAVDSTCVSFDTGILKLKRHDQLVASVLPNPTKGDFELEFTSNSGIKVIEIHDALGKLILKTETISDRVPFNLTGHADGVYYVKVISDTKFAVIKLIKE